MTTLLLLMAMISIEPLQDAIDKLSQRTPVGSQLRSADWAQVPLALRERAQFSAGVQSAAVMNRIQTGLLDVLQQNRNEFGALSDRSKFIAELAKIAEAEGLAPKDPALRGRVTDITSEIRTGLIYRTQTEMAYGYTNWKAGNDTAALNAFPAWELVRVEERVKKRDWLTRWQGAGGRLYGGRMIALKTDLVWERLSRFGTPWPPFDFNSGMGVEDVSRRECIDLGLITPQTRLAPPAAGEDFNSRVEATARGLTNAELRSLKDDFGPQLQVQGSKVQWESRTIADVARGADPAPLSIQLVSQRQAAALKDITGQDLDRYEWSVDKSALDHVINQHGDAARETSRGQLPVNLADLEGLPQALLTDSTFRSVPGDSTRFEVIYDLPDGGEALSLWEIRPGRGLKKRVSLVSVRKYMNQAPHVTAVAGSPAPHVRNVPGILNITPEQARINPNV